MIYYLVTEINADAICLVKNADKQIFLSKWAGKIVFSSYDLEALLPRIQLKYKGVYSFSDN